MRQRPPTSFFVFVLSTRARAVCQRSRPGVWYLLATQERSSGEGSARNVSVTFASLTFSGPTGLIAVFVGLTVMRAGAMLRPYAHDTAPVNCSAHCNTASAWALGA